MGVFEFITSITALALIAITVWILILRKDRRRSHIEAQGEYSLSELSTMAKSMQERIDILESILDAEVPDWREQNEPGTN
ncbi:MAG: hypothetical protein WD396_07400 [Pseudohongiellaceae bacterium]